MSDIHVQSELEETWNVVTHGLGALSGVLGAAWLGLQYAGGALTGVALISGIVYVASVVALFGVSAAYHAVADEAVKRRLQTADHCAIYGLIAGTYTPFMVFMPGTWGLWILAAVWSLAVVGVVMELTSEVRREKLALGLYLTMGWLVVIAALPLARALPLGGLVLLVLGGVVYSAGTWFYVRNQRWDHVIWHGFVLGGAGLHGASLLGFVLTP